MALLLLLGGVQLNPGPTISARSTPRDALSLGVLNVRSARRKAALIHDVIDDHRLDALALRKTWIPSDAPDAVKLDVCPPGYQVLHRHRGTSDQRGRGVALVYRDTIKATTVDVGNSNVGTVEPAYSQTRRLIFHRIQLHVRASSSHEPITSCLLYTSPSPRD